VRYSQSELLLVLAHLPAKVLSFQTSDFLRYTEHAHDLKSALTTSSPEHCAHAIKSTQGGSSSWPSTLS